MFIKLKCKINFTYSKTQNQRPKDICKAEKSRCDNRWISCVKFIFNSQLFSEKLYHSIETLNDQGRGAISIYYKLV